MTLDFIKLSPTGNITILVTTYVPQISRGEVARALMKSDSVAGEQVGYLERPRNPKCDIGLYMMGGEFCANATMAASAFLARRDGLTEGKYLIEVSGCPEPLSVEVKKDGTAFSSRVPMPLPASLSRVAINGMEAPLVRLPGISHAILPLSLADSFSREDLRALCERDNSEAFGIMFYESGRMRPFVYVKSTDTACWESACGSGTAAMAVYLALECGETSIAVSQPGGIIKAEATVEAGEITGLFITGKTRVAALGQAYI